MPVALLIIGALMVIVALNGNEHKLAAQLKTDFSGSPSFLTWVGALLILGFIGYIPGMQKPSTLFMTLCILVFVLKNGGVFDKLEEAF
ncbi:hypothetical protein GC1_00016 [Gluconobacter phage GC1]|uniref:Uncharacterized protein n=1 Tax=Gluconobacter phage GC1 TaxID=2047788 RepID=A0A2I5AR74_9VIRU|nr:hypothetical protein FDJ08_gp16 [Gluconobacter phage GC1]ATS92584.1 hypothetical protein GC1_00016 [Gluconobacter phage GC1]